MTASDGADVQAILAEQVAYYRARAPQYDRWWYRTHQYELDDETKAEWDAEVARVEETVGSLVPEGRVLELACGTGLWTEQLAQRAHSITAVDTSPEAIDLNRQRMAGSPVSIDYVEADVFGWRPTERYDAVCFSFWLSHVPPARFASFWQLVGDALLPGARAIFLDNRWNDGKWKRDGPRPDGWIEARHDIGGEYRIVKQYWDPDELVAELDAVGWRAEVWTTGRSFLVGWAVPITP